MPSDAKPSIPLRKQVLGYPVDLVDETQAIELIERSWSQKKGMHVVTLNAEMCIQAQRDSELDQVVRHARLIVPDGAGPALALSLQGFKTPRVPGIELAHLALSAAARQGVSVALLGGKPETMDSLLTVLPKMHPGLKISYSHHGYFTESDEEEIVSAIKEGAPALVLVALGVPKQEYFINRWLHFLPGSVVMGVGGSFDVWTGNVQRAPEFYRKNGLEWFYRLKCEPWRFQRMASTLPSFALQVLFRWLTGADKKTPSSTHTSIRRANSHGSKPRSPRNQDSLGREERGRSKDAKE